MARRKIIAGNWKMNMTPTEAAALVETLKRLTWCSAFRPSISFRW